ncbi:MAG TPA: sulfotransferase domain-containing protein [Isosphaeraceae bacterium]|nr:sulfotransferase domain-containing protein [Isosphaeraceae bacterium]
MEEPLALQVPGSSEHGVGREPAGRLRIAIVATPRSGHTWLRKLLSKIYSLPEFGIHKLDELDWENLPPRMALQVHWPPSESFQALMRRHDFHVVSPARHPLDLLISMLNYIQYAADPPRWSSTSGQGECTLFRATPMSEAFLQFACGEIPEQLFTCTGPWWKTPNEMLPITSQWWQAPFTLRVRYEDLVRDPVTALAQLCARISLEQKQSIEDAVAATTMPKLRATYADYHFHFWQGRPGHWKALLTAQAAHRIAAARPDMFQALGYECDPDLELTPVEADLNWYRVEYESMRHHMEIERANHSATRKTLEQERSRSGTLEQAVAEAHAQLAHAQRDAERARQEAVCVSTQHAALSLTCRALLEERAATTAQIEALENPGPVAIGFARKLNKMARRYPRLSSAVNQLIRPDRTPLATLPIAHGANERPSHPGSAGDKAAS